MQLRKSGYPEEEIQAALKIRDATAVIPAGSLDVKPVWKKILAWIGGFLAGGAVFGVLSAVFAVTVIRIAFGGGAQIPNYLIGFFGVAAVFIAGAVFIFIRIRARYPHFSYGLLAATILFTLAFISMAVFYYISFRGLGSAREKSRDARRIADVKQLQLALELYFDAKSDYPGNLSELQPKFIPAIPHDPQTGGEYIYEKHLDGSYYMGAALEDVNANYLKNDVNPGNQLYEVSESPGTAVDKKMQLQPGVNSGYALVGRAWGPEQATGAPNSPAFLGDHPTAWASLTEDNQDEWLLLSYEKSVPVSAILVYESYNPGALRQIDQVSGERVYTLWQGQDPVKVLKDGRHVARIELKNSILLSQIRLEIKSTAVNGWNEIDAVGLEDDKGKIHWAVRADASSSYAEPHPPGG